MKDYDFPIVLAEMTKTGEPFAVATVIKVSGSSLGKPGFKAIISKDKKITYGTLGGVCPESAIAEIAESVMKTGVPKTVKVNLEESEKAVQGIISRQDPDEIFVETFCGGSMEIYVEPYNPPERLIIIGQGGKDDVEDSLIHLSKLMDFEVFVIDHAPVLKEQPDHLISSLEEDVEDFQFSDNDYVVVLTKGTRDIPALKALSKYKLRYVGMLGSRKRIKSDQDILVKEGVAEEFFNQLHAPIGLDIGAITPDEIALSIMAEIVSVRRKQRNQGPE